MAENYYKSVYTGEQIDQSLARIINGELDEQVDAAGESAKQAGISAAAAKENADKTAADVVVVKEAADAERERVTAEGERKAAEITRKAEEEKRAIAELERGIDEATRREAETGRTTTEQTRVGNETARGVAEAERAEKEGQRVKDETTRKDAETKRADAETGRETAEGKRADAEVTRAESEGLRVQAETDRQGQETARETAETGRVEAEQERAEAEAARNFWEEYDPASVYVLGNKVVYQGSSWLCIAGCTGVLPTDVGHWRLIAAKGVDGEGTGDMLATTYDPAGKSAQVATEKELTDGLAGKADLVDGKVKSEQLPPIKTDQVVEQTATPTSPDTILWVDPDGETPGVDIEGQITALQNKDKEQDESLAADAESIDSLNKAVLASIENIATLETALAPILPISYTSPGWAEHSLVNCMIMGNAIFIYAFVDVGGESSYGSEFSFTFPSTVKPLSGPVDCMMLSVPKANSNAPYYLNFTLENGASGENTVFNLNYAEADGYYNFTGIISAFAKLG